MSKVTRLLVGAAAICMLASGSLVLTVSSAHADSADTADEGAFVAALNQLRGGRGLAPLAVNGQLTGVARAWASHMAAIGALAHNANLASEAPANWMAIGENVGVGGSVSYVQSMFQSSAHHFGNMIGSKYDQVGIGVVPSNGSLWVVEDFMGTGSSSFAPPPPPSPSPPAPSPPAPARARSPAHYSPPPPSRSGVAAQVGVTAAAPTTTTTAGPDVSVLNIVSDRALSFNNWD